MQERQHKMQIEQRKMALAERTAAAEQQNEQVAQHLKRIEAMLDYTLNLKNVERKEYEAYSRDDIARQEMALARATPEQDRKTIVSPG
jgi:hypothetical protein